MYTSDQHIDEGSASVAPPNPSARVVEKGSLGKVFDATRSKREKAAPAQLSWRSPNMLALHSQVQKLRLRPSEAQLVALSGLGDAAFVQPLLVTRDYIIVDGYARWIVAQRQGRRDLLCLICDLSADEALERVLQVGAKRTWLNPFNRVCLALDLEPAFRIAALANQKEAGKLKGSLNLAKAKKIDSRKEIARVAGVSAAGVSNVKQILGMNVSPELLKALRAGEVKINRGVLLSRLPRSEQVSELGWKKSKKKAEIQNRMLMAKQLSNIDENAAAYRRMSLELAELPEDVRATCFRPQIDALIRCIEREFSGGDANAA